MSAEALAGEMVLTAVHNGLRDWFESGVEHVALVNGIPTETFKADDPPCRLQSARLRGLEILHLQDDMLALAYAIVRTLDHACEDAVADIEAKPALSARLSTRGQA